MVWVERRAELMQREVKPHVRGLEWHSHTRTLLDLIKSKVYSIHQMNIAGGFELEGYRADPRDPNDPKDPVRPFEESETVHMWILGWRSLAEVAQFLALLTGNGLAQTASPQIVEYDSVNQTHFVVKKRIDCYYY